MRVFFGPWAAVLGLLFHVQCHSATAQSDNNDTDSAVTGGNDVFVVCTLNLKPMALCTVNDTSPTSFSGLSIEMFRLAAMEGLGWREGQNYEFRCLDSDTPTVLKEQIINEDGICDAFVASTTITSARTESGVVWAYPYWSGSIGVMTKSVPSTTKGWGWTKPFTWDLWVGILVTVVGLPIIIYFLELLAIKRRVTVQETLRGYSEALWRVMWVTIHGETMNVSMVSSRVALIMFAFAALILGASYTANLAAFLTLRSFGSVDSIFDLNGLAVATVEVYQPRIQSRYGVMTIEATINSVDDIFEQADQIARGNLAAFLIDAEVASYIVANYPECRIRLLPNTIEPYDYGLAFNTRVNPEIVESFSLSILRLVEDGRMADFGRRFLYEDSPCLAQGRISSDDTSQISFQQVYGLWVLLAGGIFVGALILIGIRIYRNRGDHWPSSQNKMGQTLQRNASSMSHRWEKGTDREVGAPDLLKHSSHITRE